MSIPRFSPSLFDFAAERFGETYAGSPSVSLGSFIRDGVVLSTSSYSGIPSSTANFGAGVSMYPHVGVTSPRVWTTQQVHLYSANNGNKVMTLNSRWYAHCFSGASSLAGASPASTPEKFINNVWSTSQNPSVNRTFALAGGIYNDCITTGGRQLNASVAISESYNGTSWTTRTNHPMSPVGGCSGGSTTDWMAGSGNASANTTTYTGNSFYIWNNSAWTQTSNSLCSGTNDYAAGWGKPNFGNSGFHHVAALTYTYRYASAANTWSTVGSQLYVPAGNTSTNHTGGGVGQTIAGGGGLAGIVCTQTSYTGNGGYFTKYSGRLDFSGLGSTSLSNPTMMKNGATIGTPYNNNWYGLLSHGSIYSYGWITYGSTELIQITSTTTNQVWQ